MKITHRQLRQIVREGFRQALSESEHRGNPFYPEEGLDSSWAEPHLKNIHAAQASKGNADERAAILAYLEWLSDTLYDEARQSGAPEGGETAMFDHAMELDQYVQRATADETYDELGWISNVSQKAAESNPRVGGVLSDDEDEAMWWKR